MQRNKDEDILRESDWGKSKSRDTLTELWRGLLMQGNIGVQTWRIKMDRLMHDPRQMLMSRSESKPSMRGNLRKALLRDKMTFKQFERGIVFLGVEYAKIIIEVKWPGPAGRVDRVEKTINLAAVDMNSNDDEDDNDD